MVEHVHGKHEVEGSTPSSGFPPAASAVQGGTRSALGADTPRVNDPAVIDHSRFVGTIHLVPRNRRPFGSQSRPRARVVIRRGRKPAHAATGYDARDGFRPRFQPFPRERNTSATTPPRRLNWQPYRTRRGNPPVASRLVAQSGRAGDCRSPCPRFKSGRADLRTPATPSTDIQPARSHPVHNPGAFAPTCPARGRQGGEEKYRPGGRPPERAHSGLVV